MVIEIAFYASSGMKEGLLVILAIFEDAMTSKIFVLVSTIVLKVLPSSFIAKAFFFTSLDLFRLRRCFRKWPWETKKWM